MNWPFLFLALAGGVFPLAMIVWILALAPTGEEDADRVRQQRREAAGAGIRGVLRRAAGAVRAAAAVRLPRGANG